MNIKQYQEGLERGAQRIYDIAKNARAVGLDPMTDVEILPAEDMAARVEKMVGPPGVAMRIRELTGKYGREKASLVIINEIVGGKFGTFGDNEKLAEQCVRTSLTLLTEGVTVAGTEGVSKVKICENPDGSKYLGVYFASPIRSAGGTAAGYAVMVTDYTRKLLGLQNFRPTDSEVARYVEEIGLYHSLVSRLQYFPPEEEIKHIINNCPVCIDGEPASTIEVSVYKNLDRVKTNALRGGMCLVIGEGVAQKSSKLLNFSKKHELGWDWLEGLVKVVKKSGREKVKPIDKYLADIVGGRPIFAYPSTPGGFRLRYGRARNSGINAKCIHPAAMVVMDEFPAVGTQLKIERPGKGTAIAPCDRIEPPVVRLNNGDVVRVESVSKGKELVPCIAEILFLGDMLIPYGDFLKANHPLLPSGICEEWWVLMLKEKGVEIKDPYDISPEMAIELSKKHDVPLHPKYTYFYNDISPKELSQLIRWLKGGDFEKIGGLGKKKVERLILEMSEEKRLLERLCIPHKVRNGRMIIENPVILRETLGLDKELDFDGLEKMAEEKEDALSMINELAEFSVHNKAPTYIGARMGRPEKAKERTMATTPHGLTPIGNFGGKTRSIEKAAEKGKISIDLPKLVCPECGKQVFGYKCLECGKRAERFNICVKCGRATKNDGCEACGSRTIPYHKAVLDMKEELNKALKRVKEKVPAKLKGVLGTTNAEKYFEVLDKTILRAKHQVFVFKDGTARFDATNMPLTHFKPDEIRAPVEKLRELGYDKDHLGNELKDGSQIVEMMPQDMLVSDRGVKYLTRVANFVDDLLERFYGLERFYNIKKDEDLIGNLVIGMAPHISAGTLGRIIGFTKARVGYAHPYFHCSCRRDADGDEDSIMLLLDALLNFSKCYIPNKPGGTEDIPLILSIKLDPTEVDDQAHAIETVSGFPLEFYEATQKSISPADIKIETVSDRLGDDRKYYDLKFMFDTSSIDEGPSVTRYSQLKTMAEKVQRQLGLAEKIRAVDEKDVASRILNFHFLRDIYGNLRSFGQQTFRCVDCNSKYRRVPLAGKCTRCGGKLLLTVHKGGIEKYLGMSKDIAEKYGLGDYLKQRLKLIEQDLEMIFEKEKTKQQSLADFV